MACGKGMEWGANGLGERQSTSIGRGRRNYAGGVLVIDHASRYWLLFPPPVLLQLWLL